MTSFDHTLLMSELQEVGMGCRIGENSIGDRLNHTRERVKPEYVDDLSKDMLNKWAATVATNDLFLPWNTIQYKGESMLLIEGLP